MLTVCQQVNCNSTLSLHLVIKEKETKVTYLIVDSTDYPKDQNIKYMNVYLIWNKGASWNIWHNVAGDMKIKVINEEPNQRK